MKKFFVSISIIAMLLSSNAVCYAESSSSAENDNVVFEESFSAIEYNQNDESDSVPLVNNGVIFMTEEEEEEYLNSLTDEDLAKIIEKERKSDEFCNQPLTRSVYKISIPGTFKMFQQQNSNYCVPACVQSVLYYNNLIVTQDAIAKALATNSNGTRAEFIVPYLNANQSFHYVRQGTPTQTILCDRLYTTIAGDKRPALIGIVNPTGYGWHYATNGHFLVVNAIYSDKSVIQIADPLGDTQTGFPYFYSKPAYIVGDVCEELIW